MNFDRVRHGLRGKFYNALGEHGRALAAYRDSLRADPGHVPTLRTLGYLEARQERWVAAEAWLALAVEIDPNDAHTWFNLAHARDQCGMDEAAIPAFQRATALDPNNVRAWYELGILLDRLGRHPDAAVVLSEATRLQPTNGEAWYALGMAWKHCNEPDKVTEVIEHMRSHHPQTAQRLICDTGPGDQAHFPG